MCWVVSCGVRVDVGSYCVNYLFNLGLEVLDWLSSDSNNRNVFYVLVGCVKCWRYV